MKLRGVELGQSICIINRLCSFLCLTGTLSLLARVSSIAEVNLSLDFRHDTEDAMRSFTTLWATAALFASANGYHAARETPMVRRQESTPTTTASATVTALTDCHMHETVQ